MIDKDVFQIDVNELHKTIQEMGTGFAHFGVEREGLRVCEDGSLAMTPHPAVFGDKLTAKNITTDFSESQIEMITPICDSIPEVYAALSRLTNSVQQSLSENEYLWPQSMPCALPADDKIPVAFYEGDTPEAAEANAYRRKLLAKYGGKKQMLSGIHFNVSFSDEMIRLLYQELDKVVPYREFKDQFYLKIARGYLRYRWLVIYLTGCTPGCHNTFTPDCVGAMPHQDGKGSCWQYGGSSIRNSLYGYKNITPLFPDYTSVETFTRDVQHFVDTGKIVSTKELYTQVRLKPKVPAHLIQSLRQDGIQYLEFRTVDLNVYDPCGIAQIDMQFLYHLILWLLTISEAENDDWQLEALCNEEAVALHGCEPAFRLKQNGKPVFFKEWAKNVLAEIQRMDAQLGLNGQKMIKTMEDRIRYPERTYGMRLVAEIEKKGFLSVMADKAKQYKDISVG